MLQVEPAPTRFRFLWPRRHPGRHIIGGDCASTQHIQSTAAPQELVNSKPHARDAIDSNRGAILYRQCPGATDNANAEIMHYRQP